MPWRERNETATQRPIDRWFANYSGDHRNETNQLIHVFAVPAILWSVIALMWCIPLSGTLFKRGVGGTGDVRRVDVLLPRLEATRLRHARDVLLCRS